MPLPLPAMFRDPGSFAVFLLLAAYEVRIGAPGARKLESLRRHTEGRTWEDATRVVWNQRARRSAEELNHIRRTTMFALNSARRGSAITRPLCRPLPSVDRASSSLRSER